MKKRLLSLVLCLVMVFSLFPAFSSPAMAADENGITNPTPAQDTSGQLNLTKELAPGAEDGKYDITMESWATGEVHAFTEKIPTDFVLVVDQSGSMADSDMPTGTPTVQNNMHLEDVANGAYYYKDGDNYYRVYGVKDYLFRYYPANYWYVGDMIDRYGLDTSWFMGNEEASATLDNRMYFREEVNGETYYQPITMQIRGMFLAYGIRFSFNSKQTNDVYWFNREVTTYSSNNNSPWYKTVTGNIRSGGATWRTLNGIVQRAYTNDNDYTFSEALGINTGMMINYPMYDRHVAYTKLCYRDVNGVEHVLPSNQNNGQSVWEFCNADAQAITTNDGSTRPTYSGLYKFPGTGSRIDALKVAMNEFAQAVADETDSFGAVDNRVSIVGFSSSGYNNTELLTHTERDIANNSTNGWQKSTCDGSVSEYYGKGLVDSTNGTAGTVNSKITRAITAITANGGTQPEDGLNMAYKVLTNRSNTTYTLRSGANKGETVDRNTVVIFFTDGQPGDYHYSDQYTEANDVVQEALKIKQLKNSDNEPLDTTIFTIGVFGESDANPLTYTHDTRTNSQGEDQDWKYLGGWMESYHDPYSPYSWYCLRRQWRPNSASASDNYTAEPNDTIFDYMSVVSSNYPLAEQFIAPAWLSGNYTGANGYTGATDGVRHKEKAEATNKYYRMASDQNTLIAAFLSAVTMNNEETDTQVPLDGTAVFQDQVNLADFDVTGATVSAKVCNMDGTEDTALTGLLTTHSSKLAEDGTVTVTGFDYAANYGVNGAGKKLVVTISGLTPLRYHTTLHSNKDVKDAEDNDVFGCGIYGAGLETPTVQIASPTLYADKSESFYVADFNAPLIVATGVAANGIGTKNVTNGDFTRNNDGQAVYKLGNQSLSGKTAVVNGAYAAVDSASITGVHVSDGAGADASTQTVKVVPASSVYYSDKLDTAVAVGDGSGYNAGLANQIGTAASQSAQNAEGPFYFTFYGTGIDVYCTTHEDGGYVSATLFTGSGVSACVKANRVGSAKTIRNYSACDYYNTPSVSFTGLTAGTYTLKIQANEAAQYKLDGVRVYNPVEAGSAAETELNNTDEANATYLNLRKVLLNDNDGKDVFTVTNEIPEGEIDPEAVSGVLFLDDVDSIVTESNIDADGNISETPVQLYQSQFEVYKANGPKNEIYLSDGQGLTFQLNTAKFDANTKVYIGLSAPNNTQPVVKINGVAVDPSVTTVMDMYYPVDFDLANAQNNSLSITITNEGDGVVSVTNLKITGVADLIPAAAQNNEQDALNATRALFMPVTMKTVRMAANNGVDPDAVAPEDPGTEPEVTPDPTPDPIQTLITQLISSFVNSLFNSIARLFGH